MSFHIYYGVLRIEIVYFLIPFWIRLLFRQTCPSISNVRKQLVWIKKKARQRAHLFPTYPLLCSIYKWRFAIESSLMYFEFVFCRVQRTIVAMYRSLRIPAWILCVCVCLENKKCKIKVIQWKHRWDCFNAFAIVLNSVEDLFFFHYYC